MTPIVFINPTLKNAFDTDSYKFNGAGGACSWPTKDGKGLGACGMWNSLWRLGFHPAKCSNEQPTGSTAGDVLFAQADSEFDEPTLRFLKEWVSRGGIIAAAGSIYAWKDFFGNGLNFRETEYENPYAALAYLFPGEEPQLIAPQKWTFAFSENSNKELQYIGKLAAVHGERQTPSRALITHLDEAPALIKNGNFVYFNGNPFAAFQAWLQGQEDLNPWMAWRHRLFWLDEWVAFMGRLMFDVGVLSRDMPRPGIRGLGKTTVVLKHDLDHSTDTSYPQEETKRGLAGTYNLLKDKNTSFWLNYLKQHKQHEAAFHYNTAARNWFDEGRRMITGKKRGIYTPAVEQISGDALLRQVHWAKKKGIGIRTLHRHMFFLQYPEWIDAMNKVFEAEPEVLGSSSLFRAQVLRWGVDRIDGNLGFMGGWPDAQFPLWFPFKLAHAGLGGRMLQGWESTSMMETEPELFIQMLDHEIKELPQRVITLNFHPAHANKATFYKKGSLNSFIDILDAVKTRKAAVKTLSEVYQLANESFAV